MQIIPAQDKLILKQVFNFTRSQRAQIYIVGGYLRDIFLNRKKINPDIDFCIVKGAINFGRKLAKKLGAGFVVLDKEHGSCRLVKKIKNAHYTLDFTDFRGQDLREDLLHRDFTINTLALELGEVFADGALARVIDIRGARRDLKSKTIKLISESAFKEDPLRILRAFSLAAIFGFTIEDGTLRLIKAQRNLLGNVSFERVRDELFKILARGNSFEYVDMLEKMKILPVIMPEIEIMRGVNQGPYHHLDVLKHSFEALRQLEILLRQKRHDTDINLCLEEVISGSRGRRALMKLGVLLHDIGKPQAKRRKGKKTIFHGHERIGAKISISIARRLKLSNDEVDAMRKMVFWHLRPGYLADNENISPRAVFRYFRDAGLEGLSILLISLADQRATRGRLTSKESRLEHEKAVAGLIKEYFRRKKEKKLTRLLTGYDLMREFNLQPSPFLGKILKRLEELQGVGAVKTKEQALLQARKIIKKKRGYV